MTTTPIGRRRSGMLDRSLAILALFTHTHVEWRAAEIADAVGLPAATGYRILGTLVDQGLLRQTPGGYRLGAAALDLGRRAAAGFDLVTALGGQLRHLADVTGETALLSILDEPALAGVCVDRVDSAQRLRLSLEVGRRVPLHAGAASKALLAFAPTPLQEAVAAGSLPRLGPGTITSARDLTDELAVIRTVGYAVSRQETDENAWGLAAPILGSRGALLGSVGMAGPLVRCTDDSVDRARDEVLAAASRAAAILGA